MRLGSVIGLYSNAGMCTFTTNVWAEIFLDENFIHGTFAVDGPAKNCRKKRKESIAHKKIYYFKDPILFSVTPQNFAKITNRQFGKKKKII
jgi:hypothetical protein